MAMKSKVSDLRRKIPSVTELLETPRLKALGARLSHSLVVRHARNVLEELRDQFSDGARSEHLPDAHALVESVASRVEGDEQPRLRPVINATGILLHTGLGRAPLADAAIEAMSAVARDYASLEIDLSSGQRSQRIAAVESMLRELTGAEAAVVVNNNAGATLLALAALAAGREVIVSRGQLIEIGGSFRLPEVMTASGATLREVGTTNKTHLEDYRRAINEQTAALLLVHTSNYVVIGFAETPPLDALVELGRDHSLPVIHDIGSGALIDFGQFGFAGEPIAGESILAGADAVLFSGDKLLGGPQCGIIVGRKNAIEPIARHPMMRAFRVDKLTLAALHATLRIYRNPKRALHDIPLLQLLSTPAEELKRRAESLAARLSPLPAVASALAVEGKTYLGGGSIPSQELSTWCVSLSAAGRRVDGLARALRTGPRPIMGRVVKDRLLFDLRSVFPRQDGELVDAVTALGAGSD